MNSETLAEDFELVLYWAKRYVSDMGAGPSDPDQARLDKVENALKAGQAYADATVAYRASTKANGPKWASGEFSRLQETTSALLAAYEATP